MWWIILGIIAILTVAQLLVLGIKGGIGPLGFIRRNKIANAPGNGEAYSFDKIQPLQDSPLKGKNICVLGSSVVEGAASLGWAVGEYLSARLGTELTKEAVGGTTLVTSKKNSYIQRMNANIPTNKKFDLFICQLSTNDATLKSPLGQISESMGLDAFDTGTITGALEYIICYAKKNWNCPVLFFTGAKYDSPAYEKMVQQLLALRDKWDIGVLDLWSGAEFNNIPAQKRSLYMNDNVHPTKAGYRDWWGPELERQILAYLESW